MEAESGNEDVPVGGDDWDVGEFDVWGFYQGTAGREEGGGRWGGCGGGRCANERFLEVVCGDVVYDVEEGGDTRGMAGEFGDFFIGEHDAADSVRGREEHAAVGYETLLIC